MEGISHLRSDLISVFLSLRKHLRSSAVKRRLKAFTAEKIRGRRRDRRGLVENFKLAHYAHLAGDLFPNRYLINAPVTTAITSERTVTTSAQPVLPSRPLMMKPFADLRRKPRWARARHKQERASQ